MCKNAEIPKKSRELPQHHSNSLAIYQLTCLCAMGIFSLHGFTLLTFIESLENTIEYGSQTTTPTTTKLNTHAIIATTIKDRDVNETEEFTLHWN